MGHHAGSEGVNREMKKLSFILIFVLLFCFGSSVEAQKTTVDAVLQAHGEYTTAVFNSEVDNGVAGANKTVDWTAGNKQSVTLTAATLTTFAFTAPSGPTSVTLRIVQAAGGTGTTAWPGTVKWPAGVAHPMTAAANAVDIISCYYNGANYYCQYSLDFK